MKVNPGGEEGRGTRVGPSRWHQRESGVPVAVSPYLGGCAAALCRASPLISVLKVTLMRSIVTQDSDLPSGFT